MNIDPSIYHLLSSVIGLACNIVIQILIYRCFPKFGLLRSIYLGFVVGAGLVIYIDCIHSAPDHSGVDLLALCLANLIAYACFGLCYFIMHVIGETARRARIVWEIYDSEDGLTMDEIIERYSAKTIIDKRLRRLMGNGQIVERDGRFFIGKKTVLLLSFLNLMLKRFVMGKSSEFEQ